MIGFLSILMAIAAHPVADQNPFDSTNTAAATLIVEWEDSGKPIERFYFHRRGPSNWFVTKTSARLVPEATIVNSQRCPELVDRMMALESLQVGPVLSPLTTTPPGTRLGPALYTLIGSNRVEDRYTQRTMVRSQEGPVADWGSATYATVQRCSAPPTT